LSEGLVAISTKSRFAAKKQQGPHVLKSVAHREKRGNGVLGQPKQKPAQRERGSQRKSHQKTEGIATMKGCA